MTPEEQKKMAEVEYPLQTLNTGRHSSFNEIAELQREAFIAGLQEREKEAIEFANFVGDRPLPEYSKSTNKWRWWKNDGSRDYDYATTEQLYNLFKQDK